SASRGWRKVNGLAPRARLSPLSNVGRANWPRGAWHLAERRGPSTRPARRADAAEISGFYVRGSDGGIVPQCVIRSHPVSGATKYQYPTPCARCSPWRCARHSHGSGKPVTGQCSEREFGEPEGDLAFGGLGRVRSVHQVRLGLQAQIAADTARGGFLHRIGAAGQLPEGGDGTRTLQDGRDHRARGDELDQRTEERFIGVLGVVLAGQFLAHLLE